MIKDIENNYLLRRLHSLTGILPIGLFVIFHLSANSVAIFSAEQYNFVINLLRSLPFVELIEWSVIFLPIGFHALYGIIIYKTAKPNHFQYSYLENWRYILQRATGMIALVYIVYHILQFKTVEDLDYDYIAKSLAGTQSIDFLPKIPLINPYSIYWFYVIGILSSVYHLANGIWSFCITWGITVGKKSQLAVISLSFLVFVVLSVLGISTCNSLAEAGSKLLV